MNLHINRKVASLLLAVGLFTTVAGCQSYEGTPEDKERDRLQAQKAKGDTLGTKALEEKRKREEDPNAIGYVTVLSFTGQPLGYYVVKGKVTSNGAQRTPEQDIHYTCDRGNCTHLVLDGRMDDGTFGTKDPGIFFTTVQGNHVSTSADWIHSTQPIALNIPNLEAKKS